MPEALVRRPRVTVSFLTTTGGGAKWKAEKKASSSRFTRLGAPFRLVKDLCMGIVTSPYRRDARSAETGSKTYAYEPWLPVRSQRKLQKLAGAYATRVLNLHVKILGVKAARNQIHKIEGQRLTRLQSYPRRGEFPAFVPLGMPSKNNVQGMNQVQVGAGEEKIMGSRPSSSRM